MVTDNDVDRIAAAAMGVEPSAPAAPPAPQPEPPKDSAQDKATEKGAPKTEGDKSKEDPVVAFEIDMGDGNKRMMNPEQIKGVMERYTQTNMAMNELSPIFDVMGEFLQGNPSASPKDAADHMREVLLANKEASFGKDNKQPEAPSNDKPSQSNEDLSAQLAKWEEDNAASLPPGYKELILGGNSENSQLSALQQQMAAMGQMLQSVLAQAGGTADAARAGLEEAKVNQVNAIQRNIANNLDAAQAELQIPGEAANDFMDFAMERGYTLEDFINPNLAMKVMTDFKNNMDSPEMDRLRQIARRRQAFTGTMGGAPAAPPGNPDAGGDDPFNSLMASVMAKKGM